MNLYNMTFRHELSGEEYEASHLMVAQYLFGKYVNLCILELLIVVMDLAVGGFFAYHLYLLRLGRTTNEAYKWADVRSVYDKWLHNYKVYEKAKQKGEIVADGDEPKRVAASRRKALLRDDRDVGCVGSSGTGESEVSETAISAPQHPGEFPHNIYNRGLYANVWRVFFPPSLEIHAKLGQSGGDSPAKRGRGGKKRK